MAVEKPPISRRLALVVSGAILASMVVGAVVSYVIRNPTEVRRVREEAEEVKRLEREKSADRRQLEQALAAREAEIERLRREEEVRRREEEMRQVMSGALDSARQTGRSAHDRSASMRAPQIDADLLAALEEADRAVGARPAITLSTGRPVNQPGGVGVGGEQGPVVAGIYESRRPGGGVPSASAMVGQDGGGQQQVGESARYYETTAPQLPPSRRIVAQGAQIRAVLLSRIDTRNPGHVIAQVTSNVYDSVRATTVLIPKGSRLLGEYETTISPGNHRLAIAFTRLMLPDGRAIELGGMQATGSDGVVGVQGRYRSNLARAIGPALMTTIVGSAIEEKTRSDSTAAQPGFGGVVQSPSVVQQTAPKITDAVLERYRGARPYVTAEPGQEIKVLVTADIEVPEWQEGRG